MELSFIGKIIFHNSFALWKYLWIFLSKISGFFLKFRDLSMGQPLPIK
jgi:hypothetical protein